MGPAGAAGDPRRARPLPVVSVLEELAAALDSRRAAVLVAPPGTGKTTGVPPSLIGAPWRTGKVLLVVPRRMAARAAASRMASESGGRVGEVFGYSIRHDRRVGPGTVVEVVTPGILLRRLQADAALEGVDAVLLDEFHERSVDLDLLLALLCDVRGSLREDLRLLVMSATLQAKEVASLVGSWEPEGSGAPGSSSHPGGPEPAPVVELDSALHPIRTLHRPGSVHDRLEDRVGDVVAEALREHAGDVLVFLPGRGEIRAVRRVLASRLPALRTARGVELFELHGSLRADQQDEILSPSPGHARRVVLSTAVAETSLTVPGVRIVIDSGRRRYQQVDARSGLPGLITRSVSMAGADQRRGRCGREAPGVCYRMWAPAEDELRRVVDPPEIEVADLSPLLLATLDWGASSTDELAWLDPPPPRSLERARGLLSDLGALEPSGGHTRLSRLGGRLARFGFHPRLGAIAAAGESGGSSELAAEVVAVIDVGGAGHSEVAEGVRALRAGTARAELVRSHEQWRRRLVGGGGPGRRSAGSGRNDGGLERSVGRLAVAGYADRLARRREGRQGVFHLRHGGEVESGRGSHGLDGAEWIVALEVDARTGSGRPGALHLAAPLHDEDVATLLAEARAAGQVSDGLDVRWDPATGSVSATTTSRLDAIVLGSSRRRDPDPEAVTEAVAASVERDGPSVLSGFDEVREVAARLAFLDAVGVSRPSDPRRGWPDLDETALADDARNWLPALVARCSKPGSFRPSGAAMRDCLTSELSWADRSTMDAEAPTHWSAPGGARVPLHYGVLEGDPGAVLLRIRLQSLLGVDMHPSIGRRHIPLVVELLSPAGRPVQRTVDLPGFWRGSYSQVRAEMRGRYRKHAWPEQPWEPR